MSSNAQAHYQLEDNAGFADVLRALRRWHFGKQLALAAAVGCTEAAISYWENDKRAPDSRKFRNIFRLPSVFLLRNESPGCFVAVMVYFR